MAETSLRDIVDGSPDLLLMTDEDDVITFASARCLDLLGATADDLLSRPVTETVQPGDRTRVAELAARARQDFPGRRFSVEYAALLASGDTRPVEADLTAADVSTGGRGLVWSIRDLGPRHAHDLVVQGSSHDRLTGLPQRSMLVESLGRALARGERSHSCVAVVVFRVAKFTQTWEQLGHRAAEELLLSAAGRLAAVLRPGDLLARTGVEEFGVLLDGVDSDEEVLSLVRQTLADLSDPAHAAGRTVALDPVAGVAIYGSEAGTHKDLVDQAEAAVEQAHRHERGEGVLFGPSSRADGNRAHDLTDDLDRAIHSGEVRAVYQPVVQLQSGVVSGFEALARWDHPDRGPVSPAAFIPLAESTGLIIDLGKHILIEACCQMKAWSDAFEEDLRISVNVSPRQLASPQFLQDVDQALEISGLRPEQLVLEITESGLHHDMVGAVHVLEQLREMGVQTAMDDFGTGYSSLSYLRRLPVGILKIDKCFVDDREGSGPRLLNAVIGIGRELGMDTVAEGIEDADQLAAVYAAGCTFGQGFLLSRPLEADAATELLAARV